MVEVEDKYLIMVDPTDNHNKYYKMIVNGNTWTAEYGRVGSSAMRRTYPIKSFQKKYDEKICKGYKDQTSLHLISKNVVTKASKYKEIDDAKIKRLVDMMLEWADMVIKANYTVSKDEVTYEAIDKAQFIIDDLVRICSISAFNENLKKLYTIIPRRMSNVDATLANSTNDFSKIIQREQALLDTMSGQVKKDSSKVVSIKSNTNNAGKTILDVNGISIKNCDDSETSMVREHLDPETRAKFKACYHVEVSDTRERFNKYVKDNKISKRDIKLYYHGSRNENYWNIMVQGLKLRPSTNVVRAGAMFGHGLYFAPKAKKSLGYTSLRGSYWTSRLGQNANQNTTLLMVFKVAMGKQKDVDAYSPVIANWHEKDCKANGYQSVFAHAGIDLRNDEAIVYNENACTLSYIIELAN